MKLKSKRIANGRYEVTVNGVLYCVYCSNGLWWSKNQLTLLITDCAPTKAQLFRSLEAA